MVARGIDAIVTDNLEEALSIVRRVRK